MNNNDQVILKKLFTHIFAYNSSSSNIRNIDDNRLYHITKKLKVNFPSCLNSSSTTFANNLVTINLVQRFISDNLTVDEQPFLNLVDRIQSLYMKIMKSDNPKVAVKNPDIFNKLTDELLLIYDLPSSVFYSPMKSVVIYVFELCDFGKIPGLAKSKLPLPISSTPLFDSVE